MQPPVFEDRTMKRLTRFLAAFATLLGLFAISAPAEAYGRHYGGGYGYRGGYGYHYHGGVYFNFGVPYWPGYWGAGYGYWGPRYYYPYSYGYPAPYYYGGYYPPSGGVVMQSEPTYVERSDVEAAAPPPPQQNQQTQHWWYWCGASEKYYPYVKECPGGFQRVPAQPVPPANR
jgi:hypothetical protein